jgi:hypothetical protein
MDSIFASYRALDVSRLVCVHVVYLVTYDSGEVTLEYLLLSWSYRLPEAPLFRNAIGIRHVQPTFHVSKNSDRVVWFRFYPTYGIVFRVFGVYFGFRVCGSSFVFHVPGVLLRASGALFRVS